MTFQTSLSSWKKRAGEKCARCWKVLPEVGSVKSHPDLCRRCAEAVDALSQGRA